MRFAFTLLLATVTTGCVHGPERPPPPGYDASMPALLAPDLRAAAGAARRAVETLLDGRVPAGAITPVVASQEEMEEALVEELRPQVNFLHPGASLQARDMLLRATAGASARSVVARYSARRGQVLVAMANLQPQMQASGLPTDRRTTQSFLTLVLAHEMVHAMDDEAHDLAALFNSVRDAEALRAMGMVVEGRAVHYASRAAGPLGLPPEVAGFLPGGTGELDERRARFRYSYGDGAAFIADLERRGGAALARLPLDRPPLSTSTVFHPRRFGPEGEAPLHDVADLMRRAGLGDAASASELDLRARWTERLGEEATRRAFAGFLAGAGVQEGAAGVSLSLHDTDAHAELYARGLRAIYGLGEDVESGPVDQVEAVVLRRGRAVSGALAPTADEARHAAGRALDAAADLTDLPVR